MLLENGEEVLADMVITNVDLPMAYNSLLETQEAKEKANSLAGLSTVSDSCVYVHVCTCVYL